MSQTTFFYLAFKKSGTLTIDRNVLFKKIIYFSIGKSDLKNFWFSEISGSSRTKMSPNTFFYLWSDYGRERFYERILKIFSFLKSVAQAALKCPKPLFSISLFKKSSALPIDRDVRFKNHLFFDRKVRF